MKVSINIHKDELKDLGFEDEESFNKHFAECIDQILNKPFLIIQTNVGDDYEPIVKQTIPNSLTNGFNHNAMKWSNRNAKVYSLDILKSTDIDYVDHLELENESLKQKLRLAEFGGSPFDAGYYLNRALRVNSISQSKAAEMLGVNQSTVSRLIDGGALTVEMAAKLEKVFNLDSRSMFQLEAAKLTKQAKELLNCLK